MVSFIGPDNLHTVMSETDDSNKILLFKKDKCSSFLKVEDRDSRGHEQYDVMVDL